MQIRLHHFIQIGVIKKLLTKFVLILTDHLHHGQHLLNNAINIPPAQEEEEDLASLCFSQSNRNLSVFSRDGP